MKMNSADEATSGGTLVLIGPDPDPRANDDRPSHRRRVFMVKGGGRLVVWGRDGDLTNIKKLDGISAFPCVVFADWLEPEEWAKERFDHRHWVEEKAYFKIGPCGAGVL
jgi:hypothetical protein